MNENGKISYKQIVSLIIMTISPTAILYLPTLIYKEAKQDGWISIIVVTVYSLFLTFVINKLNLMFVDKTIIEYSVDIVGKYFGKTIGLIYCVMFINLNSTVIREFSEFLAGPFMMETPILFFTIGIMLPSIFGVYKGIEVIGRTAQIILPIFIGAVVIIIILGIKDMNFSNLQPIMEDGFVPVLKGATRQMSWFSQPMILVIIMPFINNPQKVGKTSYLAVILTSFLILSVNISIITTFGCQTKIMIYPFLSFARYITALGFIERLDSIIMFLWIGGVFVKIVVLHYCSVISISQLFQVKDYRKLSIPVGIILIVISTVAWKSLVELKDYIKSFNYYFNVSIQAGIPITLIVIEKIKRRYI
ncbi:germination protein [Vallitalea longa]|uniref:Germination protein n=1 Tax=Vallitalea longa TaxID=2936439 RepID=A0A9W6DH02_9FIRM|nr:endospore germination permease [Vallitalea longa]GKX31052.1 germination protein [Vallitalea longa]